MNEDMNSLKRIEIIRGLLDSLVEAKGREKAGYISIIDDFLNHIQEDILVKDEMIKDYQKQTDHGSSETVSEN